MRLISNNDRVVSTPAESYGLAGCEIDQSRQDFAGFSGESRTHTPEILQTEPGRN